MKITRKQLKHLVKEELENFNQSKSAEFSDLEITKIIDPKGYQVDNFHEKFNYIVDFAEKTANLIDDYNQDNCETKNSIINLFNSGNNTGFSVNLGGTGNKDWIFIDQPGVINHQTDSQSGGYIFFGPYGNVTKENGWVYYKEPDYEKYLKVNIDHDQRKRIYDRIEDKMIEKLDQRCLY